MNRPSVFSCKQELQILSVAVVCSLVVVFSAWGFSEDANEVKSFSAYTMASVKGVISEG